jgi:MFS family permease
MFLLGLLTLVIATVPLAGGRLGAIADIKFRRAWAGLGALVLQTAILRVFADGDEAVLATLHLLSYGLLFFFLAGNLHVPGLVVLAIGGGLNALAIAANNGVMPARPGALDIAGIPHIPGEFVNSTAVADPKLWFFGDVFALPEGWPLANVFSVGDLLLVAGAFILLHRQSGSRVAPLLERLAQRIFDAGARVDVLRDHRGFRRLFFAQAISGIGDWVFTPAVYAAMVRGDAKASELALLLIFQVGPGMLVGLVGGPFIDRFSRKWLMFGTDVLRAVAVGSLLIGGPPTLAHVYGVSLLLGVGNALFQPAFLAAMPNFVPERSLTSANALVGLTQSLAVMIGFPLGGLIVDQFGVSWGFTANALSFAFSGALVVGTAFPAVVRSAATASLVHELGEGFRYVRGNRTVRSVILVVAMITLAAGVKSPLESLFALNSLDAGTTGLGLLGAVWGAGMILGSLVVPRLDRRMGHGAVLTASLGVVGATVLLASLSPVIAPVAVLWVAAGVANTTGTVAYETLLQERTEDAVRGRVMAALEASVQAGLLAGVGIAALTDTLFRSGDPARLGLGLSGVLFAAAGGASWLLVQRRGRVPAGTAQALPLPAPGPLHWSVRELEIVPATGGVALLRISGATADGDPPPVLLVDDGSRVHRVHPLPAAAEGRSGFHYGVSRELLRRSRTALAVQLGQRVIDLPRRTGVPVPVR